MVLSHYNHPVPDSHINQSQMRRGRRGDSARTTRGRRVAIMASMRFHILTIQGKRPARTRGHRVAHSTSGRGHPKGKALRDWCSEC